MSLSEGEKAVLIDRIANFRMPHGVESTSRRGDIIAASINELVECITDLHQLCVYLAAAAFIDVKVSDKK